MRLTMTVLAALLILLLPAGLAQAQEFSSLEERMSGSEFRESGLEKLSEAELAALNRWLRGQMTAPRAAAASAAPADTRGLRVLAQEADVTSSIAGNYRGWRGSGERIELVNGQVWETAEGSRLVINVDDPAVRIQQGMMGAWYLSVEGYNARVRVRRIR